jgi:hypothetical protein
LYYFIFSAQPVFTNDNKLTQYGEFGKTVDIKVYVYSIPKYTTSRWYRGNIPVSSPTKYVMSESLAIVNDTFHGKYVQLDGYSVMLTITNLKESDFNVSYRLQLSYGANQTVQYYVLLKSASKYCEQIYHDGERYLRKIPVERRKISRARRTLAKQIIPFVCRFQEYFTLTSEHFWVSIVINYATLRINVMKTYSE